MKLSRANNLIFIDNNLHHLSRNVKSKMWDVGGDAFDSLENVKFLKFVELSIDEPEMKNKLIPTEVRVDI